MKKFLYCVGLVLKEKYNTEKIQFILKELGILIIVFIVVVTIALLTAYLIFKNVHLNPIYQTLIVIGAWIIEITIAQILFDAHEKCKELE